MKAYHIVHHNDEDGLAAAAVIYEYLKQTNKLNKKMYFFYEVDYTMNIKDVLPGNIPEGDEIYFVDYSFSNIDNLKYVIELSKNNIKVVWIDHHKTSLDIIENNMYENINIDEYPNINTFIYTDYCGAYLAYTYSYFKLNPTYSTECLANDDSLLMHPKHIPLYIRYVDSWDTWKHNMPDTKEFNIGMRSIKRTPKNAISKMLKHNAAIINKLFSNAEEDQKLVDSYMYKYINNIIEKGKIIKEYQDINNESFCNNNGFKFTIIDNTGISPIVYNCFAVNKAGNSTMFGDRIDKYDIVVPFQFNGEKYKYSLYTSKNDIDCASLANKLGSVDGLGGGGHIKAAGFQTLYQLIDNNCTVRINNRLFMKNKYKIKVSYDY